MGNLRWTRVLPVIAILVANLAVAAPVGADRTAFTYDVRTADIPMRDGVRLHTVILVPRGSAHVPILMTRTPYGAMDRLLADPAQTQLAAAFGDTDAAADAVLADGYVRVSQDIRGQGQSGGTFVMTRPFRGPLNATTTDESTDTYDTIDWLVHHVPESNGRVGLIGISYDGFTALAALVHPHPALHAVVPINPMVDGWMGDDFFHNGAFRQGNLGYIYGMENPRDTPPWPATGADDYQTYLDGGSAGDIARAHGLDALEYWQAIAAHPAYDDFWQSQAMDRILAREPLTVPTLLVHSLWDQEDMHGALAVYRALAAEPGNRANLRLVIGPWFHHQQRLDGSRIGAIAFGSDTAAYFRTTLLRAFLRRTLYDDASVPPLAPVTAFVTGTNAWERLAAWPQCAAGCAIAPRRLYLQPGGALAFQPPEAAAPNATSYVADPAKPVPFVTRPVNMDADAQWEPWLVSDQREVASRTDVVSWETAPLTAPLRIAGTPIASIVASTSGTDGDFVVKLIDEYPPAMPRQAQLGGYQLMIGVEIFRGRYRESFAAPQAIVPDVPATYRFALPDANHVFLPGHRIVVQVQSSLFPLYDRNPQTFVPNLFFAPPEAYRAATVRIYHDRTDASAVELPVVAGD